MLSVIFIFIIQQSASLLLVCDGLPYFGLYHDHDICCMIRKYQKYLVYSLSLPKEHRGARCGAFFFKHEWVEWLNLPGAHQLVVAEVLPLANYFYSSQNSVLELLVEEIVILNPFKLCAYTVIIVLVL